MPFTVRLKRLACIKIGSGLTLPTLRMRGMYYHLLHVPPYCIYIYIFMYILIPQLIFFPIGNVLRRNEIYRIFHRYCLTGLTREISLADVKYHKTALTYCFIE